MKSSLKRKGQSGMTLVEMMIALAVGSIASYFLYTILWNSSKDTASLSSKNDFNQFTSEIQAFFNNPGRCQLAFTGQFNSPGPKNATQVPDLDTLGSPGTGTSPIQVVIDMGNTSTGGSIVYKPGMTFGNGLFIEKLEFMGKKASNTYVDTTTGETKAVAQQYEIPVHIVASRRLGGFKTTSSTDTSTGVVSTTVGAKPGSETATGGDTLEKTIILRAALSNDNKKIVGCFGQNNALWVAAKAAAAASTNLDIIHKDGGVKIFPEASTINCSTFPNANAAGTKFLLSVCGKMQFTQPTYRSDARYKENIREIPDAASRMEKLRGVKFRWKERSGDDSDQLGFIAQEVQPVFPELVRTGQDDGVMSVSYENLIAPLIEALKQRQKIIQDQERELEELRKSM